MAATWKKIAFEDDVITKALLTEQGDIIYASAAATPAALPHGTLGQVLKSGGNAANPSWLTVDDTAGGTDGSIAPVTSNVVFDHIAAADPHVGYILESLIAAKGDLISATANDAPAILTVGTDGKVLTADSDAANGLGIDWIAPGAPAAHTLNSHTAANGVVDFGAQQAHDVVFDTYATATGLPTPAVIGQIAWATDTLHPYVCTIAV